MKGNEQTSVTSVEYQSTDPAFELQGGVIPQAVSAAQLRAHSWFGVWLKGDAAGAVQTEQEANPR